MNRQTNNEIQEQLFNLERDLLRQQIQISKIEQAFRNESAARSSDSQSTMLLIPFVILCAVVVVSFIAMSLG